jgi:hypothetical protein
MQAIITQYYGNRGPSIRARCWASNITLPYPYHIDGIEEKHRFVANKLMEQLRNIDGMEWLDDWYLVSGALPDGTGYAFVMVEKEKN